MNRLGTTLTPKEINSDDYIAIYYAGGHGVMWDFHDNQELQAISREIYENGGFVSSVYHGAVGLLNIKPHIPQFHYESINTLSFKENDSTHFQSLT
jgi:putative intracellular protease/amidase